MSVMRPYTLIDHLLVLAVAAYCAWSAFRIAQSGRVHAPFGSVIATRSSDPIMFWIYLCGIIAVGVVSVVYGFGLVSG